MDIETSADFGYSLQKESKYCSKKQRLFYEAKLIMYSYKNWFGMVLSRRHREGGKKGAWRDCTLFAVITLSLEDLCVFTPTKHCFFSQILKNRCVASLRTDRKLKENISLQHWKSTITTNLTLAKTIIFFYVLKRYGVFYLFAEENICLITYLVSSLLLMHME